LLAVSVAACQRQAPPAPVAPTVIDAAPPRKPVCPVTAWDASGRLGQGETYAVEASGHIRKPITEAQGIGLTDVDLSDEWAPFIFSESDGPGRPVKPSSYRSTFIALANDRASPEEILMQTPQGELAALSAAGVPPGKGAAESAEGRRAIAQANRAVRVQRDRNYLEAYGIPPTLSVLLAAFDGLVTYQSREQAKREYSETLSDANWVEKLVAGDQSGADATTGKVQMVLSSGNASDDGREVLLDRIARDDRKQAARIERYRRGQARLRAVRAVQSRPIWRRIRRWRRGSARTTFSVGASWAAKPWRRSSVRRASCISRRFAGFSWNESPTAPAFSRMARLRQAKAVPPTKTPLARSSRCPISSVGTRMLWWPRCKFTTATTWPRSFAASAAKA
jgi:hypothetical protein